MNMKQWKWIVVMAAMGCFVAMNAPAVDEDPVVADDAIANDDATIDDAEMDGLDDAAVVEEVAPADDFVIDEAREAELMSAEEKATLDAVEAAKAELDLETNADENQPPADDSVELGD
jgi:hypothetical protein